LVIVSWKFRILLIHRPALKKLFSKFALQVCVAVTLSSIDRAAVQQRSVWSEMGIL
jgi:hypothetical protein